MQQDALEIAKEARDMACKALGRQDVFEAVSSERYKNIDSRLSQLPDISRAIGNLKGSVNKAVGAVMALSILTVCIAVFRFAAGQ